MRLHYSIRGAIREGLETAVTFREAVGAECKIFRPGGRMLRMIVVVARERPDLFGYFEKVFEGMPEIRVQLDRRLAPPADAPAAPAGASRRERRDVYDELQQRGFVMIRLW
jgi:hypothetical protein